MVCETCQRSDPPEGYRPKHDPRQEKEYCTCIKWNTFDDCLRLSCYNAKRLLEDAEVLQKNGRMLSAWVLSIYSEEEFGKAVMAADRWIGRANMKYSEYQKFFRFGTAHLEKIQAASRLTHSVVFPDKLREHLAQDKRDWRERRLYVDYDFQSGRWLGPTSNLSEEMSLMFRIDYDEKKDPAKKLDSLFLKDQLETLRKGIDMFPTWFEQHKQDHVPGAKVGIPQSEPKIRLPAKRFTLPVLRGLLDDWVDRKAELKNAVGDRRDPLGKMEELLEAEINETIRQAKTHENPEAQRYLIMMALLDLRVYIHGCYDTLIDEKEDLDDLGGAADLMQEFATRYVKPIARRHRLPRHFRRARNVLDEKRDTVPHDFLLKWQDGYERWKKRWKRTQDRATRRTYFHLKGRYSSLLIERVF